VGGWVWPCETIQLLGNQKEHPGNGDNY